MPRFREVAGKVGSFLGRTFSWLLYFFGPSTSAPPNVVEARIEASRAARNKDKPKRATPPRRYR